MIVIGSIVFIGMVLLALYPLILRDQSRYRQQMRHYTSDELRSFLDAALQKCLKRDSVQFPWNVKVTEYVQELRRLATPPVDTTKLLGWGSTFAAHCRKNHLKGFEDLDWIAGQLVDNEKKEMLSQHPAAPYSEPAARSPQG